MRRHIPAGRRPRHGPVRTIVSGGQTGVDRAALDVALALGLPCGGWCPRGRRAEDGAIDTSYPLTETPLATYLQRTTWNVRDSDATLVLLRRGPSGGTRATIRLARRRGQRCRIVVMGPNPRPGPVAGWLSAAGVRVLNVAGPRESESPGIYRAAFIFLQAVLKAPPTNRSSR